MEEKESDEPFGAYPFQGDTVSFCYHATASIRPLSRDNKATFRVAWLYYRCANKRNSLVKHSARVSD